ncbi:MAG: UDP-N-acetyl-D-glucosamine dehydrogenase, partial [Candidatus Kapabacteria bacterium]|nr:UDP-N-acetyl-D-glucosamine dehydrogenase [Candidatus Kapabacteria bacterium]MDW7997266.1 UDP-N-acetyl-D-glucosamine dehydrogenase [Bacteroidota bacterium]
MVQEHKAALVRMLKQQIKQRSITVGILGMGYVGLPLAVEFARAGIRTLGFDTKLDKLTQLRQGRSYLRDVP